MHYSVSREISEFSSEPSTGETLFQVAQILCAAQAEQKWPETLQDFKDLPSVVTEFAQKAAVICAPGL